MPAAASGSNQFNLLECSERSGATPRRVRAGVVTPFANEYFEGNLLLFARHPSTAPEHGIKGKRYWEVQVQGRFKRPVANFYMGLELTEPLKVSFMLRGLSGMVLGFAKTLEPDIHHSFGTSKAGAEELPHIVTPMFKAIDIVFESVDGVDPPPPPLGSDMGAKQSKAGFPQTVRLDATYTFTVWSTLCDLYSWKVKGVPAVNSIEMANFLNRDAAIRIVAYTCA